VRCLVVLVLAGCAGTAPPPPGGDLAVPLDLTPAPDLTNRRYDFAVARDLGGCDVLQLKINEVQTGGATSDVDEWVELYNPCPRDVSLNGSRIAYRAATNSTPNDTSTLILLSGTIRAGKYWLVANSGYMGILANQQPFDGTARMDATGGGVGLRDIDGNLADSVGWGSASNPFVETSAMFNPPAGQSIARSPDGFDTNHNATDFVTKTSPTPGAAN
jgi:hypothetical protein